MKWYKTLIIRDEWKAAKAKELTIAELCGKIADKLYLIGEKCAGQYAVEYFEWADDFDALRDEEVREDKFNLMWEDFYDWADGWLDSQTKRLWVRTQY